jgi:hypothetical protein
MPEILEFYMHADPALQPVKLNHVTLSQGAWLKFLLFVPIGKTRSYFCSHWKTREVSHASCASATWFDFKNYKVSL